MKVSEQRRTLLKTAGLVTAAAAMGSKQAFAGDGKHHHHHNHGENPNQKVIDTALDCIKTGQACLDHCFELFKQKDFSVAECAATVDEMLVMVGALTKMGSARSKHFKSVVKVCIDVCEDCEKSCREHEDNHAECKACADSCLDCIDACKAVIA